MGQSEPGFTVRYAPPTDKSTEMQWTGWDANDTAAAE
jgi:hypothetical protein